MYSILIADDDKNERDGIAFLIEKLKLPLELHFARNGKQALEILSMRSFDFLLTDIKMPFVDGLELAGEAKRLHPNLGIIILSGHGEFEYAKQAIMLGVSDYLLKPISVDEFKATLEKAIRTFQQERERDQRLELLTKERLLLAAIQADDVDIHATEAQFDLLPEGRWVQMVLVEFKERFFHRHHQTFNQLTTDIFTVPHQNLHVSERQCVCFLQLEDPNMYETNFGWWERLRTAVCEQWGDVSYAVVFGSPTDKIDALRKEFERMELELEKSFYIHGPSVFFTERAKAPEGQEYEIVEQIVNEIEILIAASDIAQADDEVERLEALLSRNGSLSLLYVKHLYSVLIRNVHLRFSPGNYTEAAAAVEAIMKAKQLSELRPILIDAFRRARSGPASNESENHTRAIDEVIRIIDNEYNQDLSLEYLARRVHLSGSYLSHLFKKKTGKTVVKYINQLRMEKAKFYLSQENYKIVDVYRMVGYSDVSYFGLAFKNHFGLTPSQYRAKVRSK